MATTDPRSRDPFTPRTKPQFSLAELTDSFAHVDYAETTALLSVIQALTPDETLAARIGKELKTRRQPMPRWVTELGTPKLDRVVRLRHLLGDGDDYFVATRLPSGEPLTGLVYIDHNIGTVVKDAFVVDQECDAVERVFWEKGDVEDCELVGIDAADARATITAAIQMGAMTYPQPESDEWPASRPLVEWLVRGGSRPRTCTPGSACRARRPSGRRRSWPRSA